MKPPTFDYYDPATLEEALELMERYGSEAKVLAGGQSLMPLLNLRLARPSVLVDLNRIPGMDGVGREDGWLRVGALARQWDVEHAPEVVRHLPVLRETLRFVAHPQIRMRGTVGGSIAHADPAAELPAVLVCLDGEVVAYRRGGMRIIAARELFVTYLTTNRNVPNTKATLTTNGRCASLTSSVLRAAPSTINVPWATFSTCVVASTKENAKAMRAYRPPRTAPPASSSVMS